MNDVGVWRKTVINIQKFELEVLRTHRKIHRLPANAHLKNGSEKKKKHNWITALQVNSLAHAVDGPCVLAIGQSCATCA